MSYEVIRIEAIDALVEVFTDETTCAQLKEMKLFEHSKGWITSRVRTLVDARGVSELRPRELREFMAWSLENNQAQEGAPVALLVDGEFLTALAMLFETGMSEARDVRVFSTLEGALEWLKIEPRDLEGHWSTKE